MKCENENKCKNSPINATIAKLRQIYTTITHFLKIQSGIPNRQRRTEPFCVGTSFTVIMQTA
jgi:hypothetical protein